jgi:AraC-like DNA-binding protein
MTQDFSEGGAAMRVRPVSAEPAGVVPEGFIRCGPFTSIPDMLRLEGIDAEAVLAASGLDNSTLSRSENVIPFSAARRLLALAAAKTGRPDFGLRAGQRIGMAAIGVLGMAMQNCCSLSEALSLFTSHYRRHDGAGVLTCRLERPVATMSYSIPRSDLPGSAQAVDFALAIGAQTLKSLCGPRWRPIEARMARPQPQDPGPYRALVGDAVRFDAPETALIFDADWLDYPLAEGRPELRDILLRYLSASRLDSTQATRDDVRRQLCVNASHVATSLNEVALAMNIHPRTLARRLASTGTTFKALASEIRHERALQLLEQTSMTVADIAALLGYADVGSFSRAFKSRAGMPPKAWRARRIV